MKFKKKHIKLLSILTGVFAVIMLVFIVLTPIAKSYEHLIDAFLQVDKSKVVGGGDENVDSEYFKSEYAYTAEGEEKLYNDYMKVYEQIAEEGTVLIQNKNETLPITGNKKVVVYDLGSNKPRTGGAAGSIANELNSRDGITAFTSSKTTAESADYAIVEITRASGEGADPGWGTANGGDQNSSGNDDLALTAAEKTLLSNLYSSSIKVIVLLNLSNQVDSAEITKADAVIWSSSVPRANVFVDLLLGKRNFSGRTVDTFFNDNTANPVMENFGYFMADLTNVSDSAYNAVINTVNGNVKLTATYDWASVATFAEKTKPNSGIELLGDGTWSILGGTGVGGGNGHYGSWEFDGTNFKVKDLVSNNEKTYDLTADGVDSEGIVKTDVQYTGYCPKYVFVSNYNKYFGTTYDAGTAVTSASYSLTFRADGATGDLPSAISFGFNASVTLPEANLAREGYTFVGWEINRNTYQPGESVGFWCGSQTANAQWQKDSFYVTSSRDALVQGKYAYGEALTFYNDGEVSCIVAKYKGYEEDDVSEWTPDGNSVERGRWEVKDNTLTIYNKKNEAIAIKETVTPGVYTYTSIAYEREGTGTTRKNTYTHTIKVADFVAGYNACFTDKLSADTLKVYTEGTAEILPSMSPTDVNSYNLNKLKSFTVAEKVRLRVGTGKLYDPEFTNSDVSGAPAIDGATVNYYYTGSIMAGGAPWEPGSPVSLTFVFYTQIGGAKRVVFNGGAIQGWPAGVSAVEVEGTWSEADGVITIVWD